MLSGWFYSCAADVHNPESATFTLQHHMELVLYSLESTDITKLMPPRGNITRDVHSCALQCRRNTTS